MDGRFVGFGLEQCLMGADVHPDMLSDAQHERQKQHCTDAPKNMTQTNNNNTMQR